MALGIHRALVKVAAAVKDGRASCSAVAADAISELLATGFDMVEYLTVVDAETLTPLERVRGAARVIVAARLGRTRLIDNLAVD